MKREMQMRDANAKETCKCKREIKMQKERCKCK